MNTLVNCNNVVKTYSGKYALSGISLNLERGKIIGLLGPNGSGKTTLIKLLSGILTPTSGSLQIDGKDIGIETKKIVSYLPDKNYLNKRLKAGQVLDYFEDFYEDFNRSKALHMLEDLQISPDMRLKNMSKGTLEKFQLILVMSREAKLYILDEPIAGVDPAARDYILRTILGNYDSSASILISTHLISDIENILDQVIFIKNGEICLDKSVDDIRMEENKSVDALFREVFKC